MKTYLINLIILIYLILSRGNGHALDPSLESHNVTLSCADVCSSGECEYRVPQTVLQKHHIGPDSDQEWKHGEYLLALYLREGKQKDFKEPVKNVSDGILITRRCLDNITMELPYDSNQKFVVHFNVSEDSQPVLISSSSGRSPLYAILCAAISGLFSYQQF